MHAYLLVLPQRSAPRALSWHRSLWIQNNRRPALWSGCSCNNPPWRSSMKTLLTCRTEPNMRRYWQIKITVAVDPSCSLNVHRCFVFLQRAAWTRRICRIMERKHSIILCCKWFPKITTLIPTQTLQIQHVFQFKRKSNVHSPDSVIRSRHCWATVIIPIQPISTYSALQHSLQLAAGSASSLHFCWERKLHAVSALIGPDQIQCAFWLAYNKISALIGSC